MKNDELETCRRVARVLEAKRAHAAQTILELDGFLATLEGNGVDVARARSIAARGLAEVDRRTLIPNRLGGMNEYPTVVVPRCPESW